MQQEWLQQEVTDTKVLKMSSVHNPRDSKYFFWFNSGRCFCIPSIRFEFNSGRCKIFQVPVSVSIPEDAHVGFGPPIPYSMYFRIAIDLTETQQMSAKSFKTAPQPLKVLVL